MAELVGNCLVAQSCGPTAVVNASVAGVVTEALNHNCIEEVYGGLNGVLGMAQALGQVPGLAKALAVVGALFLAVYGGLALRRARFDLAFNFSGADRTLFIMAMA